MKKINLRFLVPFAVTLLSLSAMAQTKPYAIYTNGSTTPTLELNGSSINMNGQALRFDFMRNRIINGDMKIDQRYGGAQGLAVTGVISPQLCTVWTDGISMPLVHL